MKKLFMFSAIALSLLASTIRAEPAEQPVKIKVLDRWLGTWDTSMVLKPA
ncbi:MAG: hypothetical protein QGF00_16870 [Planctomycetota bacterium]|nr:hypothetical protein [Planctomycetota bacterium]MDP7251282.1 hypothetical protein [Planctomycetota bacterium]